MKTGVLGIHRLRLVSYPLPCLLDTKSIERDIRRVKQGARGAVTIGEEATIGAHMNGDRGTNYSVDN